MLRPSSSDPLNEISPASRVRTARALMTAEQWRESAWVASVPVWRIACWTGVQAGASLWLAAVLCYLSPWSEAVGYVGLGALAALFGRFHARQARQRELRICVGLLLLAVALPSLGGWWSGSNAWVMLLCFSAVATLVSVIMQIARMGAPGAVIVVFAAGAAMTPIRDGGDVVARLLATAFGGLVAVLLCRWSDGPRVRWLRRARVPRVRVPVRQADVLRVGLRVGLAAGAAAGLAFVFGAEHYAWAGIGAVAVVQSTALHLQMNRALQRTAGTCVGALLTWLVLSVEPSFWTLMLCIALLQWLTEAVIGYNYAFGQAMVTPMALLMTYLAAAPASAGSMPAERVLDTMLGAGLGMVMAVLLSSHEERNQLLQHRRKQGPRR